LRGSGRRPFEPGIPGNLGIELIRDLFKPRRCGITRDRDRQATGASGTVQQGLH
jgi:hypothetical protein